MRNILIVTLLLIISITVYTLTIKGISGNIQPSDIKNKLDQATKPFELSPERGRFLLTMSLAEDKSFALSKELADAAFPDVGYYNNKFYIFFAPGISLMALPFYIMGKNFGLSQVFSFAMISVIASFNILLIYLIAKNIINLSARIAILSSLIFAFASTSWSYAVSLYQHHVSLFLMLSAFYSVWMFGRAKKLKVVWAAFVWVAYAWSIWLDYPNAILMLPVMFYFLIASISIGQIKNKYVFSWKAIIVPTSIFFFLIVGIHGYYNQVNFGSWKRLSGSIPSYKKVQESDKVGIQPSQEKNVGSFFREDNLPKGFSILLFSRDRGLFLYAPIFLLAVLGIYSQRKKINLETGTLLGLTTINIFLYSSWGDPWGGWAYGPRYLIPSMAFLSIFVGIWLTNAKHKILNGIVTFFLFAYSCFIALMGVLTTSQVPPKVEADFLKMKYNFLLNWDYFVDSRSSSYVYNNFFQDKFSLIQYFLVIYLSLLSLVFLLLFVVPLFSKKKE